MGYNMSQVSCSDFLLKKEKFSAALEAIKSLAKGGTIENSDGSRRYSWVDPSFATATTLEKAINAWNWDLDVDENGNGVALNFNASKLGDDSILLGALAPFVESGEIEMAGEERSHWKWVFKDGKVHEFTGQVVYEAMP